MMSKDRNPKVFRRGSHGRIKQNSSQLSTPPRSISSLRETIEIGSSDSDVIVLDSLSSSDDDLPSYSYITPPKKNVAGVHRRSHQGRPSPSRRRSSSPRRISETPSPRVVSKTKPSSSLASNSVSRSGTPLPKRSKLNSGSAVTSIESARSSGAKKLTHGSGSGASMRRRRSPSPAPRRTLAQERSRHRSESSARGRLSSSQTSGHCPSASRTVKHSPLATHSQRSGFSRQPLKERSGSKGSSCAGKSGSRGKNYPSSGSKDTAKRGTFCSGSGPSHRQREVTTGRLAHLGNQFSDSDSSDSVLRYDLPDEPGLVPSRSGAIRSPAPKSDFLPSQGGAVRGSTSRRDLLDKAGLASSGHGSTSGHDLTDEPGLVPSRSGAIQSPANSTSSNDLLEEPMPVPSRSGAPSGSTSRRDLPDEPMPVPSRSGAPSGSTSRRDLPDGSRTVPSGSGTTSSSTSRRDLPDKPVPAPAKSGAIRKLFTDKDNSQKTTLNKTRHRSCNLPESPSPVREASGSKTAAARKRHATVIDLLGGDDCDLTAWEVRITPSSETDNDTSHLNKATESDKPHYSKVMQKATGSKSHPSKVAETTASHPSKVAESTSSHPRRVVETTASHSKTVLGTGKSHSSKVAETGKARSNKMTETGKSCSGKVTETSSKVSSTKATDADKSHPRKASEADKSHSSETSETDESHSSKASETDKSHTSETNKSHSTETGSKSNSSKEAAKSHSSKLARSAVGNKKPSASQRSSASRLLKSPLPSSPTPPGVASGTGSGLKSQSHNQQGTPIGSPLKSLPQVSSTGKGHSDVVQSRSPHSPTFPTVPSLPVGTERGPKSATGTGRPRNKAPRLTTPHQEVPDAAQPTSSGSSSVSGITGVDPTMSTSHVASPASAIISSKSSSLGLIHLKPSSSKKPGLKSQKTSRRIKLKRSNPASQDVLTRLGGAAVTKAKGRGKGKQAVGHAQDKESPLSSGSRAELSAQSGSNAGCLNIPSRPHSRESVSTLSSSCFPESTCSERIADDIESLWSCPSMADPSSDMDTMSIVSGAGSLDIAVTLGSKAAQQTQSANMKRKHVRRQTARKSTGGFSFKRPRPSYSSGRLSGYGMVPLKLCTVDITRTKWSRKRAGAADGSSGSSVQKEKIKQRKKSQQPALLTVGGSRTDVSLGQTSTIKLHSGNACLTGAAKPTVFVDIVLKSEHSIPDGVITPKKRRQRKEAKKLPMVLESSDSEPDTDPIPAAKKPKLTPFLPPTAEHRETSSAPELSGETCARTRVNKLPLPRKRIRSESSHTSAITSPAPLSSLPANASHSSASPLQLGTLWDDSSRQTIKKVSSKSNLSSSVSLTPEVARTKQCSVTECSSSGASKSDVRDGGVASSQCFQLSGTETMQSEDDSGVAVQSFRADEAAFLKIASSKNKLSLRLKPKQGRSISEPPASATSLPTPPPEKSSSVPPLQIQSLSSPVSPAPPRISPRDKEYGLRLQETIAKLAGGGAEEDGRNFGSPRRLSLLSPPTLATSQSDLTVSFRLASLRQQPSPPTPTDCPRSRLPSVTTTRLGTYVSQGVQAEIGMVVNREVLDSYLTVKTNEVLYELKEMLEAADRQVARITKEKEELEKMVMEKERVIQKLTQTGFKYRQKRVDKATSTEKTTKSASTQTKKLRMPKPKRSMNKAPQKSGRTKHTSWNSLATARPAETHSCLRNKSEEELQPFLNRSFSPPLLAPCSPSSGEPDAGGDAETSEWLSREDSTSRCIPIRPQVRLLRAVRGGERLRRHSEPTVGTRRNGLALAEWDSLDVNLQGEFLQLWQMLNLFKELRMEPLLLRRLASVIENLDHLLSHVPPPQDQELALLDGDLQQRTTVGLSAWLLGSKLQQLILNLEKLHADEKNHLPSYFRAELIHTRTVVIETLRFITHGMRHVTMFHDTKGFAIGTNTLFVPSSPSPDLSPSPASSSLLQCNEEDLDDLFSSSASELESSSSEEEVEEAEGRSARTSHFRYKRVPSSPTSCARVSPWCAKGAARALTNASKSGIGVSPDVSMSIATAEPGLLRLSRAIQQLKVPTSTSGTSQVALSTSSGTFRATPCTTSGTSQVALSASSGDSPSSSSPAEKVANPSQNMDRTSKVALLEKVAHSITEKINQITANRLPVPNRLNQLRDLFPVHPLGSGIPIAPATTARSPPSPSVMSPVCTATTGVGKNSTITAPSSVVHINARDLLPSSATERITEASTPAAGASSTAQTTANISGTVCTSRVSPQQFTRITDILTRQQSNPTPKPMVVGPMAPLTSHARPVTTNPPTSLSPLPLPNILRQRNPMMMKFRFKTLSLPPPSVNSSTSSLPRAASTQVLNAFSNHLLPSNQMLPSNADMEQLRQLIELSRLSRNHLGLPISLPEPLSQGALTAAAAVRAVQIPRHPLGPGIDLTAQAPSIAAAPPAPPPNSTSQLTASPCQWTPENVSISRVATVNTKPHSQAGPAPSPHPLVGTDSNLVNSRPCPATLVSRLSTGVPLVSGLPTPRLQVVSTSQGIMIKWTFGEEHIHKQCYVNHYDLYAHANSKTNPLPPVPQWGKVGSVNPLPLPMAVTLTNFARGQCYFFAVRALFRGGGKSDYSEPKSVTL